MENAPNIREETEAVVSLTNEFNSYQAALLSTVTWTLFYQMFKFSLPTKSPEYHSRLVTTLHGLIATFVGLNQCFLNESLFEHPEWKTTNVQNWLLITSLGYFIYDLAWCLYYQTETKLMIAHHIYSVYAIKTILSRGHTGALATCGLGTMEVTNPILQFRWFLRSEGFHTSFLFSLVEVIFMALFFFCRIILGTYYLWAIAFVQEYDWNFRVLSLIIYIMSWMFMIDIINYARLKHRRLLGQNIKSHMDLPAPTS